LRHKGRGTAAACRWRQDTDCYRPKFRLAERRAVGRRAFKTPKAPSARRGDTILDSMGSPERPEHAPSAGAAGKPHRRRWVMLWPALVAIVVIGGLAFAVATNFGTVRSVADLLRRALWLLPWMVALHLGELFCSGLAWRALLPATRVSLDTFWRLRIAREGIDSLLPVAQVGGEIVGAQLLSRRGTPLARSAASVVVDITLELVTLLGFMLIGLALLTVHGRDGLDWMRLLIIAGGIALVAGGSLLAQRFGLLRLLEALSRRIARHWPGFADVSLDGLQAAARGIYQQTRPMAVGGLLHLLAWMLGTIEAWAVLHALGVPISVVQALIIESLGMAGRGAGFAIPAAIGAQEGGFVLAAAAVGVHTLPALALSLVKRAREILVGLIGLVMWRLEAQRASRPA
jgi:putative membrane protein